MKPVATPMATPNLAERVARALAGEHGAPLDGPGLDRSKITLLRNACEVALAGKNKPPFPFDLRWEEELVEKVLKDIGFIHRGEVGYEKGFYVAVSDDDEMAKVGISQDPAARIKNLQTATGRRMRLVAAFPFTALQLEQMVLTRFVSKRRYGEWLARDRELDKFIEACAVIAPTGAPVGAP